jgi:transposase-like protein
MPVRSVRSLRSSCLRWHVEETYVKVAGKWRYVYRAIDQAGQVIDVLVSARRNAEAGRRFFERAIRTRRIAPVEVVSASGTVPSRRTTAGGARWPQKGSPRASASPSTRTATSC